MIPQPRLIIAGYMIVGMVSVYRQDHGLEYLLQSLESLLVANTYGRRLIVAVLLADMNPQLNSRVFSP